MSPSRSILCSALLPSAVCFTDFLPYALDLFGVCFQENTNSCIAFFFFVLFLRGYLTLKFFIRSLPFVFSVSVKVIYIFTGKRFRERFSVETNGLIVFAGFWQT